jgi:flagellar basal-body rod protein FlgB
MSKNDGNSVDIDVETTEMSKNSTMYNAIIAAMKKEKMMYSTVIDASSKLS